MPQWRCCSSNPVVAARAVVEARSPHVTFDMDGDDQAVSALLAQLVTAGVAVTHFAAQVSDLEEVFMRVTDGSASGGGA